MATPAEDGRLASIYRQRIGDPTTRDEVRGYWVFLVGLVLGTAGIVGFLVSTAPGGAAGLSIREVSVALAGAGLTMLFAGPVIRLPLRNWANSAAYVGQVIGFLAVAWFVLIYPENWAIETGYEPVLGLYTTGLAVIAFGGVIAPLLVGSVDADENDRQVADLEANLEAASAELNRTVEERDAALDEAETASADRETLEARLDSLVASQARFELYQDRSDEWRWRLRHRNGNVIADSGEGYTRTHNAQKGIESVRRNALGATTLLIEADPAASESDSVEPIDETQSQSTIELYEDAADEWRFRVRHDNGNIIGDSGEGYASASNARRAIESLREYVGPAAYLRFDPTGFEVYRDASDQWRWRLLHRNGEILADGGEGYTRRHDAIRAVDRLRDGIEEYEFEVFEDAADEYRWRLEASNGRIVADSGEGYASKDGAKKAVERVREYAPEADALAIGRACFELYEDRGGDTRWRLRHRNGNILLDSGEGYASRSGARNGIESIKRDVPNADIERLD